MRLGLKSSGRPASIFSSSCSRCTQFSRQACAQQTGPTQLSQKKKPSRGSRKCIPQWMHITIFWRLILSLPCSCVSTTADSYFCVVTCCLPVLTVPFARPGRTLLARTKTLCVLDRDHVGLADLERFGVGDFHQRELEGADRAALAVAANVLGHQRHGVVLGDQLGAFVHLLPVLRHANKLEFFHLSLLQKKPMESRSSLSSHAGRPLRRSGLRRQARTKRRRLHSIQEMVES